MESLMRKSFLIPTVVCTLLLILIGVWPAACGGRLEAPAAPTINDAPIEISLADVVSAYERNSASADTIYKGKRLYFSSCTVEKVSRQTNQNSEEFIIAGGVKFEPKYFGTLDNVTQDTIVDIIGDCSGMMFGAILFRDCWIKVVGGPTTIPSGY